MENRKRKNGSKDPQASNKITKVVTKEEEYNELTKNFNKKISKYIYSINTIIDTINNKYVSGKSDYTDLVGMMHVHEDSIKYEKYLYKQKILKDTELHEIHKKKKTKTIKITVDDVEIDLYPNNYTLIRFADANEFTLIGEPKVLLYDKKEKANIMIQHIRYNINLNNTKTCKYSEYHGNNYKECTNLLGFLKLDTIMIPSHGTGMLNYNKSLQLDEGLKSMANQFYNGAATTNKKERFVVCLRLLTTEKPSKKTEKNTMHKFVKEMNYENNKVYTVDQNGKGKMIDIIKAYTSNINYKKEHSDYREHTEYTEIVNSEKFMYNESTPQHNQSEFYLPGEVLISTNCMLPGVIFYYDKLIPENPKTLQEKYTYRNLNTDYTVPVNSFYQISTYFKNIWVNFVENGFSVEGARQSVETAKQTRNIKFGGSFEDKYMKYKKKYLNLKKIKSFR